MVCRLPIPLLNLTPRVSVIRGNLPPLGTALCHHVHLPRCHPSRLCPLPVVLPSILGLQKLPVVFFPARKLPNLLPHPRLTTVLLGQSHVLRRLERITGLAWNVGACLPPVNGRISAHTSQFFASFRGADHLPAVHAIFRLIKSHCLARGHSALHFW